MLEDEFLSVDLNLLVALHLMLEERSVKNAARRLGLTPSGMSRAITRLRELLDDELFVRAGGEMIPTELAAQLGDETSSQLQQLLDALTRRRAFEPRTSERTFRIATADYFELLFIPPFVRHIVEQAPQVRVQIVPIPQDWEDQLMRRQLDFVINVRPERPRGALMARVLTHETFVCLAAPGVIDGGGLTIERYTAMSHVLVTPTASPGGIVDDVLQELALTRHVALTVSTFSSLGEILPNSEFITTVPSQLASHLIKSYDLSVYDVPIELPRIDLSLIWHARSTNDMGHVWMRRAMESIAKQSELFTL